MRCQVTSENFLLVTATILVAVVLRLHLLNPCSYVSIDRQGIITPSTSREPGK